MMVSARMDLEANGILRNLTGFSPILEEICGGHPSKEALLSCEPFNLVYLRRMLLHMLVVRQLQLLRGSYDMYTELSKHLWFVTSHSY